MSRYDGLIIPRSYSEYINKTDAATLQQALQLSGVLSAAVAAGDNKAVKSSAVNEALINLNKLKGIVVTSDTDFWNAIQSLQANRSNCTILIGYTTALFNNILGVIQCTNTDDTNMIRGVFSPIYEDKIYSLLINVVLGSVTITELAKKSDLDNYVPCIQIGGQQQSNFITRFDINNYLIFNCKLSIDIFVITDGNKEIAAKVMISKYNEYEPILSILYNSNSNYPVGLNNGGLEIGNGQAYTYGGNIYITIL